MNADVALKKTTAAPVAGRYLWASLLLIAAASLAAPAHAYLDPGTGSIILQSFLAAIAVAATTAGMYWQRIKFFFLSRFSSRKAEPSEQRSDSDE